MSYYFHTTGTLDELENVVSDFRRELDRKTAALEVECQRLSAKCKELEVKYEESSAKSNYLENSVIPNLLERLDRLEASMS